MAKQVVSYSLAELISRFKGRIPAFWIEAVARADEAFNAIASKIINTKPRIELLDEYSGVTSYAYQLRIA